MCGKSLFFGICWTSSYLMIHIVFVNQRLRRSSCINRSLTGIIFNCNTHPPYSISSLYLKIFLTNFYFESNPPLNKVQLIVFEVLVLHANTQLIPSDDSCDLSTSNNKPTEVIMVVLVGITFSNKLG